MKIVIKRVTPDEVNEMVDIVKTLTLRQRKEVNRHLRNTTPIYAGFYDGDFAAVWGVIPPTLSSDQAYIWVYTTDVIEGHEFLFVRYSQRVVEELLKRYDRLVGLTEIGETRSIRWLKWLGAEYGEPEGDCLPFVIRRR